MLNIVKSLLFRLKKSKLFWILFGVCAISPLLLTLLLSAIESLSKSFSNVVSMYSGLEGMVYSTLDDLALINGSTSLLVLICVSVFLCKEFNYGTIRNTILSNKSRVALFSAYLLVGVLIGLSYLLAYYVMALLTLGLAFGFDVVISELAIVNISGGKAVSACLCSLLLGVFSTLFVVTCTVMFLFVTGKQAPSIILPLLIVIFLPDLIEIIVAISATVSIFDDVSNLVNIANKDYSWVPFFNATSFDSTNINGGLIAKILMYYVIFICLFTFLGGLASVKKDLK